MIKIQIVNIEASKWLHSCKYHAHCIVVYAILLYACQHNSFVYICTTPNMQVTYHNMTLRQLQHHNAVGILHILYMV